MNEITLLFTHAIPVMAIFDVRTGNLLKLGSHQLVFYELLDFADFDFGSVLDKTEYLGFDISGKIQITNSAGFSSLGDCINNTDTVIRYPITVTFDYSNFCFHFNISPFISVLSKR